MNCFDITYYNLCIFNYKNYLKKKILRIISNNGLLINFFNKTLTRDVFVTY